ncbi:hypothetical protein COB55_05695 [Candidatus Wolfebacteria bacterium]|nr:MAG: hypothetical protein COB55_05695 [Candidatus Wolfebacteria bacterium]
MKKILIVIILIIIAFFFFRGTDEESTTPNETDTQPVTNAVPAPGNTDVDEMIVAPKDSTLITYTNEGFSPKEITVEQGQTVTFLNESNKGMWVASDVHPSHEIFPEFDAKTAIDAGSSYEFTFETVGPWAYHNHFGPGDIGVVVVK